MINYLLRLIKIALVVTISIGGGIGLLVFIVLTAGHMAGKASQHAAQYGLTASILVGLVVAAVFFCVMMPLDLLFRWNVVRDKKTNDTKSLLENEQIRELTLTSSKKQVHFACRQALLSIPGVKNVHDDAVNQIISATTGSSWRSPGEDITVEIKSAGSSQFHLHCLSRPSLQNVVFDYGKNFENVETWKTNMQEYMKTGGGLF